MSTFARQEMTTRGFHDPAMQRGALQFLAKKSLRRICRSGHACLQLDIRKLALSFLRYLDDRFDVPLASASDKQIDSRSNPVCPTSRRSCDSFSLRAERSASLRFRSLFEASSRAKTHGKIAPILIDGISSVSHGFARQEIVHHV